MGFDILRSKDQAVLAINASLGTSDLNFCSSSELLRATIWGLTASSGKTHINRVLAAVLPAWQVLSQGRSPGEGALRRELREGLLALHDAGDLIELPRGYWAPATARFVKLPEDAGYLLVGGVPSAFLFNAGHEVRYRGPHRHLDRIPIDLSSLLPVESFESWARLPSGSLADWAKEIVDSSKRRPYSPTILDPFEFYLPARVRPGTPQFKRWFDSAKDVSGTVLARRVRVWGSREYRLMEIVNGRIASSSGLHGVDARRLMYAFDLLAGNSVHATCVNDTDRPYWLLTSELPWAEQRSFAALGTLDVPKDRPYQRRWTILRNESTALQMLRALGIAIKGKIGVGND